MTVLRANRSAVSRIAGSILALALLAGCATPPPADDPEAVAEWEQINDPLEPFNRGVFEVNRTLDTYAFKPAAQAYRAVVPKFGRERIHNVLSNLSSPLIFANDLLQGEVDRAVQTLFRAAINTSIGLLGIHDVASEAGIPPHEEDFGQTMAVWGVGEGPFLMLPVFGPSNPRDAVGMVAEMFADPFDIHMGNIDREWISYTRTGFSGLNKREGLLDSLDEIERTSLDYYASLRSLYRQHRAAEIKNHKTSSVRKDEPSQKAQ
ncbi:VacJ family lipoprotein [Magnetospirillum sp. SS-4]|uniref:MlaA family lipoprotein n=1 Tax=Magnetospirillum sp. SS-4 TaxID=2681465 RepID=UPI0013818B67|nr:VacJ family lipoprotein [Magnetospirillum sp. SS-4]CAA7626118.1 Surface lipoprotein [Magnetospirillum sp. SS-4]